MEKDQTSWFGMGGGGVSFPGPARVNASVHVGSGKQGEDAVSACVLAGIPETGKGVPP